MTKITVKRFENKQYEQLLDPTNSTLQWMGFDRILMKKGESLEVEYTAKEAALVLQSGKFSAKASYEGKDYGPYAGERNSVFDEKPTALYIPPNAKLTITADTDLEFRIFTNDCAKGNVPNCVMPDQVDEGEPGNQAMLMKRKYRHVFGAPGKANDNITTQLIVGETVSCPGGWIGFPAHRHDVTNHEEHPLDEVFSFKIEAPTEQGGYILQHSYNTADAGEPWDEVNVVDADDFCLGLGSGYHTSLVAPECRGYLLWGLGGAEKIYKVKFDPRFDASNF